MKLAQVIATLAVASVGFASAQGPDYKPAQAAYLKGEIKRAQERFVEQATNISGVPAAKIREWVPTDGRDVPPKVGVLPALERARGKPFSEEERRRFVAADQERFDAIARAKHEALKR